MTWMIANGCDDKRTLGRRIKAMEAWIAQPELLKGDADADYAALIESANCCRPSISARFRPGPGQSHEFACHQPSNLPFPPLQKGEQGGFQRA